MIATSIDRLRLQHECFRARLEELERVVTDGRAGGTAAVRSLCRQLAELLHAHIRQEWRVAMACRKRCEEAGLNQWIWLAVEHEIDEEFLQTVLRAVREDQAGALDRAQLTLAGFITGFRRHMREQEQDYFPVIERLATTEHSGVSFETEESFLAFWSTPAV